LTAKLWSQAQTDRAAGANLAASNGALNESNGCGRGMRAKFARLLTCI